MQDSILFKLHLLPKNPGCFLKLKGDVHDFIGMYSHLELFTISQENSEDEIKVVITYSNDNEETISAVKNLFHHLSVKFEDRIYKNSKVVLQNKSSFNFENTKITEGKSPSRNLHPESSNSVNNINNTNLPGLKFGSQLNRLNRLLLNSAIVKSLLRNKGGLIKKIQKNTATHINIETKKLILDHFPAEVHSSDAGFLKLCEELAEISLEPGSNSPTTATTSPSSGYQSQQRSSVTPQKPVQLCSIFHESELPNNAIFNGDENARLDEIQEVTKCEIKKMRMINEEKIVLVMYEGPTKSVLSAIKLIYEWIYNEAAISSDLSLGVIMKKDKDDHYKSSENLPGDASFKEEKFPPAPAKWEATGAVTNSNGPAALVSNNTTTTLSTPNLERPDSSAVVSGNDHLLIHQILNFYELRQQKPDAMGARPDEQMKTFVWVLNLPFTYTGDQLDRISPELNVGSPNLIKTPIEVSKQLHRFDCIFRFQIDTFYLIFGVEYQELLKLITEFSGCDTKLNIPIKNPFLEIQLNGNGAELWRAFFMISCIQRRVVPEIEYKFSVEVFIPAEIIGRLIGRTGQVIRSLEGISECSIQIPKARQGGETAPMIINGYFIGTQLILKTVRDIIEKIESLKYDASLGVSPAGVDVTSNIYPSSGNIYSPSSGASNSNKSRGGGALYSKKKYSSSTSLENTDPLPAKPAYSEKNKRDT